MAITKVTATQLVQNLSMTTDDDINDINHRIFKILNPLLI